MGAAAARRAEPVHRARLPIRLRHVFVLSINKMRLPCRSWIAAKPSDHWAPLLAAADCCCTVVRTPAEAAADSHFEARGTFGRVVTVGGVQVPALPLPIVPEFRGALTDTPAAPDLGEQNTEFGL